MPCNMVSNFSQLLQPYFKGYTITRLVMSRAHSRYPTYTNKRWWLYIFQSAAAACCWSHCRLLQVNTSQNTVLQNIFGENTVLTNVREGTKRHFPTTDEQYNIINLGQQFSGLALIFIFFGGGGVRNGRLLQISTCE